MLNMLLGNLLLLLNLVFFSCKVLKKKYANTYFLVIGVIIGVIVIGSKSYPQLQLYGTFIMISYYFILVFSLFNGNILKKVLTVLLFFLIASISEIISSNILNIFFGLEQYHYNTFLYSGALLLSGAICFFLLNKISEVMSLINEIKLPKNTYLIFILPISTALLLVGLNDYFETFRNNYFIAFVIVGLLVSNYVVIDLFYKTLHANYLEREIRRIEAKYETINTLYQTNFNFLHDTTRKLMSFQAFFSNHDYEELSNQINMLNSNLVKKYNTINSNSAIINSILNTKLDDIQNRDIQVKTDTINNDFSFLNVSIRNELFSILINNAIESCMNTDADKPLLIIRTKIFDLKMVIEVIYNYQDEYETVNNIRIDEIKKLLVNENTMIDVSYENIGYCDILIVFNKI